MGRSALPQTGQDAQEEEEEYEEQRQGINGAPGATFVAVPATAPEDSRSARKPAGSSLRTRRHNSLAAALALVVGSAAGAAVWIALRRWRQRRRNGGPAAVQRAAVTKEQVFSAVLALREPSAALPPPSTAASALAGRSLVLSDRLDVQSLETRFGCDAWKEGRPPAAHTYWPVDALVAAGAVATATVLSEPLGLGPLLSLAGGGTPNPAGCGRTHGGGDYGAAVSVAGGLADLALSVDELGSARVPAACCGAYVLRTTAGVLPLEGATTACPSLAAPALLAADAGVLLKAGQALRLPGGGAATEVPNYLVAEDFFAACREEMRRMVPAVVAAVKRWAGPDQAKALSLCNWLYHRVASLAAFLPDADVQEPEELQPEGGQQQQSERVLCALSEVAHALRQREFVQQYGPWVEAHQAQLPAEVVEWWRQAQQVDEGRYRLAQGVAAELQAAMREALKDGYVFVLPTTPGPAPPAAAQGGNAGEEAAHYRQRCLQFAAMASLSGAPAAALPVPIPGGASLGVTLLALHKRDLVLAQAAVKLGPLLAEEAAVLARAQQQAADPPRWQPAAAGADRAGAAARAGASSSGSASAARQNGSSRAAVSAEAAATALAYKEAGNAAYKAGRDEEAVRQYSAAIRLDPRAVYYSNRAQAFLKLGMYGDAEADCDAALKLERTGKTLLRRGSARLCLRDVKGAMSDFRDVLALEPGNRQAKEELARIKALGGAADDDSGGLGSSVQATI